MKCGCARRIISIRPSCHKITRYITKTATVLINSYHPTILSHQLFFKEQTYAIMVNLLEIELGLQSNFLKYSKYAYTFQVKISLHFL